MQILLNVLYRSYLDYAVIEISSAMSFQFPQFVVVVVVVVVTADWSMRYCCFFWRFGLSL